MNTDDTPVTTSDNAQLPLPFALPDLKEYEMTEAQAKKMLDLVKPPKLIAANGQLLGQDTQQDRVNKAWQWLAGEMHFQWDTAMPVAGKDVTFFTALPLEVVEEGVPV